MLPQPTISTLFPYTTLFRSVHASAGAHEIGAGNHHLRVIELINTDGRVQISRNQQTVAAFRSEERRVGKECKDQMAPDMYLTDNDLKVSGSDEQFKDAKKSE